MSEITETTARLHENSGRESYKVRQRLPRTSSVNKAKMYGRGTDHENIVESLLRYEIGSENGFSAVPIVGMPGVGKTTLAQHVYYDVRVQDHFDLQAWTCVGSDLDVLKVTKSILKSIATDQHVDDNDLNLLQGKLKKQLSGKKFLLVLDDVWIDNHNHWNDLRRQLFESCAPGSKVVITTRLMNVATMMATTSTYPLEYLSYEDCLRILAEQSLGTTDFSKHQSFMKIGKKLVIKCYGLPLLAKAIGGLLRGKYSLSDWEDVLNSDMWNLSSDEGDGISPLPALRVCYHYLTPCLKKCLVSCSRVDYEFDEEELVSSWIAEGLLHHDDSNMQMKDLGLEVFKELYSRSLLQQSSNDPSRFVMHGLIHDLALWAAEGLFGEITTQHNDTEPILGPSEGSSHHIHIREDTNIEDHKAQERSNWTVDLERIFVITNFIFELPSVVFDQLSSVHKPQYALLSMLTSSASLFISIFGLVYKCTRENVTWKWRGALPWLYYPSPSDKLFGNFNDIVGLVCALGQCILSAITYGFVRRQADNPIKVSVWPIIFAFGLLCSNLFKKPEKRSSIS